MKHPASLIDFEAIALRAALAEEQGRALRDELADLVARRRYLIEERARVLREIESSVHEPAR
jgi:hypothetical protein